MVEYITKENIGRAVAIYFLENAERFSGEIPQQQYFTYSEPDNSLKKNVLVYGSALDILAELIERKSFFGEWISESVDQVSNCNNGTINLPDYGASIRTGNEVTITENGPKMIVEEIGKKQYLDVLRSKESFKSAAALMGVEDLEAKVDLLFE